MTEDLADHKAAHQMHEKMLDEDLKSSTSEVDITAQIVEMARSGGSGLPGNRSVSWDPPYQCWAPEKVAEASVIPRMNQPREVCNFDVALEFVKRLRSLKHRSSQSTRLEVVYHWTREENVNKIIDARMLSSPRNGEAFGRGIYASTDVNYGRAYGAGLSCGFLCLAFPGHMGRTPHGKGIPKRLCKKDDCYQQGSLRVYRSSEQVLPLFFTDLPTAPRLSEVAQTIARVLRERVLEQSVTELEFKKGEKVEVLWHGSYWQAEVAQVRADGLLDVKWLFPFQTWPAECGCKHRCWTWSLIRQLLQRPPALHQRQGGGHRKQEPSGGRGVRLRRMGLCHATALPGKPGAGAEAGRTFLFSLRWWLHLATPASLPDRAGAREDGSRPDAVRRSGELLAEVDPFDASREEHRQKLAQAVERLRCASDTDLSGPLGQQALQGCEARIQALFDDAMQRRNEKDSLGVRGGADVLRGTRDLLRWQVTLQLRLRQKWDLHSLKEALNRAAARRAAAEQGGTELEDFMDALDLAEFHGRAEPERAAAAVEQLLKPLERRWGRPALQLQPLQQRVLREKGLQLLKAALWPAAGQHGFPELKRRKLRHAMLTARSAMDDPATLIC
eukprot:g12897.t1